MNMSKDHDRKPSPEEAVELIAGMAKAMSGDDPMALIDETTKAAAAFMDERSLLDLAKLTRAQELSEKMLNMVTANAQYFSDDDCRELFGVSIPALTVFGTQFGKDWSSGPSNVMDSAAGVIAGVLTGHLLANIETVVEKLALIQAQVTERKARAQAEKEAQSA